MQKNKMFETIIAYGVGNCYRDTKDRIQCLYDLDFVCDRKFDSLTDQKEYQGIPVIPKDEIKKQGRCLVIICLYNPEERARVKEELENEGVTCRFFNEVLPQEEGEKILGYEELKEKVTDGKYQDEFENRIYFCGEIPQKIKVRFYGVCNSVYIGKDVYPTHHLLIECGTKAIVKIGDYSTFCSTDIYASWGTIEIGNDTMFSFGVCVRNTDSHHIFSITDGKRVNYTKPVKIGNHVWIGQNVILLPGAEIEHDSVVGAGAVTSGKFPANVIIGGNPAKIIRENITWTRPCTYFCNHDNWDE